MKTLIVCLLGFATAHAMASNQVRYEWPSANGIAINHACVDGDNFRSLTPVKVCTEVTVVEKQACTNVGDIGRTCRSVLPGDRIANDETLKEITACTAYSRSFVTVSRTHDVDTCTDFRQPNGEIPGQCMKLEKVSVTEGRVFDVPMYYTNGEASGSFAGTKTFTIPDCM